MPRRRGPPKGNTNARTHGFYSRALTRAEKSQLDQETLDYRANNVKFFRVLISRVAQRVKPSASNKMSFQENVVSLQTVVLAVNRILGAANLKRKMQTGPQKDEEESMIKFMEGDDFMDGDGMTRAEIEEALFDIAPLRKKGGQPGNLNALKHGFFAGCYTAEEIRQLDDLDEYNFKDEVILLQVLMQRVFSGLKDRLPLPDFMKGVRVLSSADACLERLNRERGFSFTSKFQDAIEEGTRLAREDTGILDYLMFPETNDDAQADSGQVGGRRKRVWILDTMEADPEPP